MSELNKEALDYLVSLGKVVPETFEINGEIYVLNDNGRIQSRLSDAVDTFQRTTEFNRLKHERCMELDAITHEYSKYKIPATIDTRTLESIVSYVKANPEGVFGEMFKPLIHIESNSQVTLSTKMDIMGRRHTLIKATSILPKLTFGQYMPVDMFIIMLQTQFSETPDKDVILRLVSNLTDEESLNIKDDGVKQVVTVKKGIADLGEEKIPNPLVLAPFRTFVEAEQPRSYYLVRLNDKGNPALFEVGSNEWQIIAMRNIKKYFEEELKDMEIDIWM